MQAKTVKQVIILLCGGPISAETSWRTIARIDLAVEKYKCEEHSCILISSGTPGNNRSGKVDPESHAYHRYLIQNYPSVNPNKVFIEDLSRDTVGNVYFSLLALRAVIKEKASLIWISNEFHLDRVRVIIDKLNSNSRWLSSYAGARNHHDSKLMEKILASEELSIKRFNTDIGNCSSVEELIFCKHDFYSIMRLGRRFECAS